MAEQFFGSHVKTWQEGRSGGWLVVDGLRPLKTWDAIDLMKWYRFQKAIKAAIKDLFEWENVKELVSANRWAEPGSQRYNFFQMKNGQIMCLCDCTTED